MTATATKNRKAQRTMQYYPASRLLFITEGKKSIGYIVSPLDTANAFTLTKADGTQYNVLLDGVDSLCDCIGFMHRGMNIKGGKGCKHLAALAKLRQLGKL
ncbi:MAG: hypothetical protein ACYC3I_01475 [Gemmataceae bacterium]